MSIPSIAPYPMPGPAEIPAHAEVLANAGSTEHAEIPGNAGSAEHARSPGNAGNARSPGNAGNPAGSTSWAVDPARAALLILDMQEYCLRPFPAGQPPVTDLVGNASRLRRRCAESGIPVSYTSRPDAASQPEGGAWVDFWKPDTAHRHGFTGVTEPLAPAPHDRVFTTWRHSAFHAADLAEFLATDGRDQLILCGVYAHVGILVTACDALARDLRVFLVADAVADLSPTHHRLALVQAAQRSAVTPITNTVLEWLGTPRSARRSGVPDPIAGRVAVGRQSGRSRVKLAV